MSRTSQSNCRQTETDKTIKATKAAHEKQRERASFLKSVKQKLDEKNDLLLRLSEEHKAAIIEHLSSMVAEKAVERNEIYAAYVGKVKDISAIEEILDGYRAKSLNGTDNGKHAMELWQKTGGVFSDNSLGNDIAEIKQIHLNNLKKAGVNL